MFEKLRCELYGHRWSYGQRDAVGMPSYRVAVRWCTRCGAKEERVTRSTGHSWLPANYVDK